jgi:alpha-tubulin suppressor-like RCC1 family protein
LVNNTNNSFKEIYCWGKNELGQVGVGAEDAIIETESNVTQIIYSEKK